MLKAIYLSESPVKINNGVSFYFDCYVARFVFEKFIIMVSIKLITL